MASTVFWLKHSKSDIVSNGPFVIRPCGTMAAGERRRTQRKNCISAVLSTTDPTSVALRLNLNACGETMSYIKLHNKRMLQNNGNMTYKKRNEKLYNCLLSSILQIKS
jgi:hypothetical protein